MRKFLVVLAAVFGLVSTGVHAQQRLSDPFSAQGLTQAEKRMIQAGLALEGHYNALLDGAWGGGSQRALVAMVKERHETETPSWNHVARLIRRTQRDLKRGNWQVAAPSSAGVSALIPLQRMSPTELRSGQLYETKNKGLRVQILRQNLPQALSLATAVANRHVGNGRPYQSFSGKRLILAVTFQGGGAYLRSAEVSGGVGTVLVEWQDAEADSARLIISSIAAGTQANLRLPKNGTLAAVMERSANGGTETETNAAPTPTPPAEAPGAVAGTGFYVNNTDLVAPASVVAGCAGRLLLGDGARTRTVAVDAERGVAILTSGRRSNAWMPIGRARPTPGQALGIATFDPADTAPNAVARVDNSVAMETPLGLRVRGRAAPSQMGSAVFNEAFELAGMVVPTQRNVRGTTGFVASQDIAAALRAARVLFVRTASDGDGETGQKRARRVVRLLYCKTG